MIRAAEFESELKRILRRAARIQAYKRGEADVKKVHVDGGWVKRHQRKAHDRLVITLRKTA